MLTACTGPPVSDACLTCAVAPAGIQETQAKLAGLLAEPHTITLTAADLTALLQDSADPQAIACITNGRLYVSLADDHGRHWCIALGVDDQNRPEIVAANVAGQQAPTLLRRLATSMLRAAIVDIASPRRISALSLTADQLTVSLEP